MARAFPWLRSGPGVAAALLLATAAGEARAADAFLRFDHGPLEDQVEIVARGKELLAFDAWSGAVAAAELDPREDVLWLGVRGRIGLVVTGRRLLAVAAGTGGWVETDFGAHESLPERVALGGRVALVATDRRVLALEGVSGTWSEIELEPREEVLAAAAGTNVAAAVTRKRVIGISAGFGAVSQTRLEIREEPGTLRAYGSLATLTTGRRILTMSASEGSWRATKLSLR